jgi:hypothetical protein
LAPNDLGKGGTDTGIGKGTGSIGKDNLGSNLSNSMVNTVGYLTGTGMVGVPSSSRSVTNNVVVNNPTAEPASTSVSKSLKKLSAIGSI